ncbi:hypothetical protein HU200_058231 [Digitaria exilis]|uniref:[RNA-polymerase]-subunit kinase n=1 Tax=Digitaria exilis TaxID=1010633 RepID=A0A835AA33_9POAL|nr:hypothetical protein HU200_058231 [Digitaria exilis]
MPTATCAREASALVGDRLAAACDMIEWFRDYRTPITGRRAAAISAMIADIAAAATAASDEKHTSSSPIGRRKKKARMGMCMDSSSWYDEVSRLGKGHFGVVSKARHRATGHVVAIKSLRSKRRCGCVGDDDEGDYDLLREACFMAACRGHPSLVGLHAVLRAPVTGDYSLAMDYVGPTTLVDVMSARHGEADVRRMMRQLLEGADAMHRRGIVHRDIKPHNILVDVNGGALRICDLGVATYVGERDPPYVNTGTLPYMAPEVLVGSSMDHDDTLVDSWSLGCVMAELLLGGHELFKGKSTSDQLYKIFDVLGVPDKKAWQSLKPSSRRLADEVRQWRTRQQRVGHRSSSNRLRGMFTEEVLSKDGFEVLSGLLTCDPRRRLTAATALRCRWFADNVVDVVDGDYPLVPAAPAVSETPTTTVWSQVVAGVGRVLGLLRPKGLFNSIIGLSIGK